MQASAQVINDTRTTEREKSFYVKASCIFLVMIIMSAIGWIAENTVKLISSGKMDNRFHVLPFIFPYGLAFLAMYAVLGNTNDIGFFGKKLFSKRSVKSVILSNIMYVSIVSFFVFIGELSVGNLYEFATGAKLWDYSSQPLHLTQYVSLSSALGYGVGAYIVMKALSPLCNALIEKGNIRAVIIADCTLGAAILTDSVCMILITLITKTPPVYWAIQF